MGKTKECSSVPYQSTKFVVCRNLLGRFGGSINGAMFLKEFVDPKTPWAHVDIAATANYDREFAGYPAGATAFGVGLGIRWLRDRAGSGGRRRAR